MPPRTRRPGILRPALAITGRLRTSARLATIMAMLLVPGVTATWSFASTIGGQIGFASSERAGVVVLRPALSALATVVSGGSPDLSAVHAAVAANPGLGLGPAISGVDTATSGAALGTAAGRSTAAAALATLIADTGNNSNLILDPDLDSFYVMDAAVVQLPKALQAAARAAAPGNLSGSELIAAQAVNAGILTDTASALTGDVDTATKHTAAARLTTQLGGVSAVAAAFTAMGKRITSSLSRPEAADPTEVARTAASVIDPLTSALDGLLSARTSRQTAERTRSLAITLVGLLLALWCGAAVWWQTRHDVRLVVAGVGAIAEGRLDELPLPQGHDEFGDIGSAVALARARLSEQEQQLAQAAQAREQQLQAGFQQQREAEQQLRLRAQSVIDETAGIVGAELQDVVTQVEAVRDTAGTIDERVREADRVTNDVVARAAEADRVVGALVDSLRRVAGMAQVISGVADQTKLLALNASIEAARAGESGRGFSVVANEVKDLATTTAQSTQQITGTIQALESDAAAVASTIAEMSSGIRGLDAATGALGNVATEQHGLVARLDAVVCEAIDRVASMSSLTQRLERRRAERVAARGRISLDLDGRTHPARLRDLSVLGAQVVTTAPGLRTGQVVSLSLTLGNTRLQLSGRLVRVLPDDDGTQLGIEFVDVAPADGRRLQEQVRALSDEVTAG